MTEAPSQIVLAWRPRKGKGGRGGLTQLPHHLMDKGVCRAATGFVRVC